MNWIKRNIIFTTLVVAFIVLLAVTAWFLRSAIKERNEWQARLDDLYAEFDKSGKPSEIRPTPQNRLQLVQNLEAVRTAGKKLVAEISQQTPRYRPISGFAFHQTASNRIQKLLELVNNARVHKPPVFGFGLYYYARGAVPHEPNTPRLLQQLDTVETITKILIDSGVTSIDEFLVVELPGENVQKSNVELAHPPPPETLPPHLGIISRSEGARDFQYEYHMMPFSVSFRCDPKGLVKILNTIAASPNLYIVARVDINSDRVGPTTVQAVPVDFDESEIKEFLYGEDRLIVRLLFYQITFERPAPDSF